MQVEVLFISLLLCLLFHLRRACRFVQLLACRVDPNAAPALGAMLLGALVGCGDGSQRGRTKARTDKIRLLGTLHSGGKTARGRQTILRAAPEYKTVDTMRSGAGYRRLQIRLLQQPALVLGPRLARKPHRIVGRTRVQENLWTLRWRSRLCNPNCFRHSCVYPPPVRIIRHIGACVLAWRRRDIVARKQRRRSRPQPRQFVVVERLELVRARQRFAGAE